MKTHIQITKYKKLPALEILLNVVNNATFCLQNADNSSTYSYILLFKRCIPNYKTIHFGRCKCLNSYLGFNKSYYLTISYRPLIISNHV